MEWGEKGAAWAEAVRGTPGLGPCSWVTQCDKELLAADAK